MEDLKGRVSRAKETHAALLKAQFEEQRDARDAALAAKGKK